MFKLFKDLTRPPERLDQPSSTPQTPPISAPSSLGYTARQRTRPSVSVTAEPGPSTGSKDAGAKAAPVIEEAEEVDEDAKKVMEYLGRLETAENVMGVVELLSQLLSIKPQLEALRSFRRHRGFSTVINTLARKLHWHHDEQATEEERQVQEVQRMEGIRLAFEVLAWAQQDRRSALFFEKEGGYLKLLPILRKLGPPSTAQSHPGSSAEIQAAEARPVPQHDVLAMLLAHIFDNNYSFLSTFKQSSEDTDLDSSLGDLRLRWGGALGALWAYLWGLETPKESAKGKERARDPERQFSEVASGQLERSTDNGHLRLVETTLRVLLVACQRSPANLFILNKKLPFLQDFLLTRLYGYAAERKYAETFPARSDWIDKVDDEEEEEFRRPAWIEPSPVLREVYLALFRKSLETGVDPKTTWRLFSLVKTTESKRRRADEAVLNGSGIQTPTTQPSTRSTTPVPPSDGADKSADNQTPTRKNKKRPNLTIPAPAAPPAIDIERLDVELLDLIRHGMKSRWPDLFVFRGGHGMSEAGIELHDMGRAWPTPQKGFNFSSWVYITRLSCPFTLLHVSQSDKTLFQLRILDNSQISILSRPVAGKQEAGSGSGEEIVCPAPDALIAHQSWVHFSISCRQVKSGEYAEARIFVNGVRVGAMKIAYPQASPLAPGTAKTATPPDAVKIAIGKSLVKEVEEVPSIQAASGKEEDNEIMLGRTLLLEEFLSEDLVLLLHHLGPRYHGNLQEAAAKFLTYEGATSINIYLSSLGQTASDKRLFTTTNTSILVKAIRSGPAIPEENVLLSLSASDLLSSHETVVNAAVPHPWRARQLRHGLARLHGDVHAFSPRHLDDSVSAVGGGVVILKLVDLSQTPEELAGSLAILREMIKDSWRASEEMERIRGFELLAALLRPKMPQIMDVACTKIVLAMLGVNMDKPASATVHNSVAYRALGVEFELWSYAPLGVTSLYLEHFQYLLIDSKHRRFNLLRTFQKSSMIRKLLYALRSGLFEPAVVPVVVDTLKFALEARWSGEDAIKPVFSYLVTALCQNTQSAPPIEPPPSQAPAAYILTMIAELSHSGQRLVKLNKSIALHRLLVVFISSNPAYYVIVPSLEILEQCLSTLGLEGFQRSFETEGGFALLAKTLPGIWRDDIQGYVFRMMLGEDADEDGKGGLKCPGLVSSALGALDILLQLASDEDSGGSSRPMHTRTRSGTISSTYAVALTPLVTGGNGPDDDRLSDLLQQLTETYRSSNAFRRALTSRKLEMLLPAITDFATITASSSRSATVRPQREAAAEFLQTILDLGKLGNNLNNQLRLVLEQLVTSGAPSRPLSASMISSPMGITPSSPARPSSSSYFGTSLSNRFGTTPPSSIPSSPTGSIRRRPSTEAGQTFNRARSIIERRAPLKRVLTNESILEGGKDKNAAWKLIIIQTDSQRQSKMTLERKEHWQRLGEEDWPRLALALRAENGLWPDEEVPVTWRLDGSEGPLRMRARLERVNAQPEQGVAKTQRKLRDAIPSVDELSSAVSRVNVAPWEDPFALALGEAAPIAEEEAISSMAPTKASEPGDAPDNDRADDDSFIEVEESKDDKMRRIAKTLEAGDVVEEAHNIIRIVGVDACPGLLIIGKKNLYLIDGLVQTPDGAVIDAKDAPKDVLTVPSGTLVELDSTDQQSHRWSYNEIVESNKRMFLFRDVALELYFSDKRNFLIVFRDKRQRQGFMSRLLSKNEHRDAISRSVIGNFVLDTVARAMDKSEQQLEAMTRRWQNREISNFAYLQLLNQHANRTPNDVTQYPVFPWVLADYSSLNLEFERESTFRNLALPMGALTPARQEAAVERYSATEGVGEKPFHYGTHYSSSMIVCGYMIRASPFTEIFLALQGGNFDLADRLFSSVPRAWESASAENRGDVRELIPEFYYSPAFLLNVNHHDFGKKQASGDTVDNVALPPWALGDPTLFIHRHREALESDYVSRHLPHWIDLTFGWKQRDAASFNCFHPLSYRGAVDLESIKDEGEKAASTAIIHNFGQTPEQIFKGPHPHRFLSGRNTLPVGQRFGVAEGWQLLLRSILPITETTMPIDDLVEINSSNTDVKPTTRQKFRLDVPGTYLTVQYGFTDESLRVYYQDPSAAFPRLIYVIEGISTEYAIFAAPTLLITVSVDNVLTAWRLQIKNNGWKRGDVQLEREATLRGHTSQVTCLAASASWSLLVSGTTDGTAKVWDTNRLRYTRTLRTTLGQPIKFCTVHEANGQIALATAKDIFLYSLNGHPIAHVSLANSLSAFNFAQPVEADDQVEEQYTGSLTFLNREFLKYGSLFVVGVGSQLALYRCVPGVQIYDDEEIKPWTLEEQGRLHRSEDHEGGDCTMVKFIGETLYAAFASKAGGYGKHALYQWSLPEGNARHVSELSSGTCMTASCGRHFGLLEPRRHCGGCGGAFCGTHAVHVENFQSRYCESCRGQLSRGATLGLLSQRRDSVLSASSRRGSLAVSNPGSSRPGSRRGSILAGHGPTVRPALGPSGLSSRPSSRPPSRRPSVSSPTPPPVFH